MSVVFLNGWGVSPEEAKRTFANSGIDKSVRVVSLREECADEVCRENEDTLVAYSTGAFFVMQNADAISRFKKVFLLAPFFDFKKEAALGGQVGLAQLKYLLRWLKKDPLAAVNDFRARAGIGNEQLTELPENEDALIWGIELLLNESVALELPEGARGFVGAADPLLDAKQLAGLSDSIEVVPEVGHELGELLPALISRL